MNLENKIGSTAETHGTGKEQARYADEKGKD